MLLFACRRAFGFEILEKNLEHFTHWLLYIARRSPTCLPTIARFFIEKIDSSEIPVEEIRSYILEQIPIEASCAHTSELSWLLYLAKKLKISIPKTVLENAMNLKSSVNCLLLLDLRQNGLVDGEMDYSFWSSFANREGLSSEMWLATYEATKKDWWPKKISGAFISDDQFFRHLLSLDINFYNEEIKIEPTTPLWALSTKALKDAHEDTEY